MVSKSIGGTLMYLKCHVTGTGLSGVGIWLTKYGLPVTRGVNLIGPLPNGDGTVQMNVQVQLERKDAKGYQCHVKSDTIHACLQWGKRFIFKTTCFGPKHFSKSYQVSRLPEWTGYNSNHIEETLMSEKS